MRISDWSSDGCSSDLRFQAAAVTKPIAAFAALRLVDQGQLSLDSDVDAELQSWKVPASPLLEGHPITLRGILSHSAGLVPGGYGGLDRKRVVLGKRVLVRVDTGGRRFFKKQTE